MICCENCGNPIAVILGEPFHKAEGGGYICRECVEGRCARLEAQAAAMRKALEGIIKLADLSRYG